MHINGQPQTLVEEKKQEDDKKYITEEDEQERIREKEEELYNEISENDYDSFLNEVNDCVRVGGMEFDPSKVLYECDRTAYDEGFNEYRDGEMERLNEQACEIVAEQLEVL